MIVCPNPDCHAELETFEATTMVGALGSGLYVDCPNCGHRFEIEVFHATPREMTA